MIYKDIDKLKALVDELGERMNRYNYISETHINQHHKVRFAAKHQATRDCRKELMLLINEIEGKKVYNL